MDQHAGPVVGCMLGRRPRLRRVGEAGNRHFGRQAVVGAEGLLAVAAVAEGGAGVGGGSGGGGGERVGEIAAGAGACEVYWRDKSGLRGERIEWWSSRIWSGQQQSSRAVAL